LKNILYLLGSGRSGTTLLATILNSTPNITSFGELHQFYTYVKDNKKCSCGKEVNKCSVWNTIITSLNIESIEFYEKIQTHEEKHKFTPFLLLGKKSSKHYKISQNRLFDTITTDPDNWILDSSKYVSRFLLLNQLKNKNIKGIYVVRDVRGVINSFSKQVQTPKTPFNTILYYLLTNFFAQIVCWTNSDVIKIRYEDLVEDPLIICNKIYSSLLNTNTNISINSTLEVPHIIGGNRLKTNKSIKIQKDDEWKQKISRKKQIIYYILCLPLMLINKYKI